MALCHVKTEVDKLFFFVKGPDSKYFGLCGASSLLTATHGGAATGNSVNKWACCVPLNLYLRTLKLEFHVTFNFVTQYSFDFSSPFKNIKTILSLKAIQKHVDSRFATHGLNA